MCLLVRYALCGVTSGHTFPAGVAALHSNQLTEIHNKVKEMQFECSCFIHQEAFMKLIRLKEASKKPILELRLRTSHPTPAVTRRKIPFVAKPE